MSNDKRRRTYSKIWDTFQFDETVVPEQDTKTIDPSGRSQTVEREGPLVTRELPEISGTPGPDSIAEVEFGDTLGEGGSAEVISAQQIPLDREVAVKRLRANQTKQMDALLQEAWITGHLEHPNIVPVYRLGRDDTAAPIMVMKRIEGIAWSDLLDEPDQAPRAFDADDPLDLHLDILNDVCDAIRYAHDRQILHCDLKPQNVMVGAFGEVYVVDWGLAVSVAPDGSKWLPSADDINEPAGTAVYMAPEMAKGDGSRYCVQTDVYLLGAMLHHVITGEPPHSGESMFEIMFDAYDSTPPDYDDDVPERLVDICHRAMARDPQERFDSAEAFQRAILDFQQHRQSLALSQRAEERLEDFRQLADAPDDQEATLYETFGECRFGFERALEVDPDNDRAREGLQEVMEQMIERELDQDGYKAASLLLADLPESRPDLEARAEDLRRAHQSREMELEKLKERERDHDVERGRKSRSLFVLAMGAVWGLLSFFPDVMQALFGVEMGYAGLFVQSFLVAVIIGAVLAIGRRQFFQNTANRRLVVSLLCIIGSFVLIRQASLSLGLPMGHAKVFEMLMAGGTATILGICIDRRVIGAALPYAAGGLIAAKIPESHAIINTVADGTAMALLALLWWPGVFDSVTGPAAEEMDDDSE